MFVQGRGVATCPNGTRPVDGTGAFKVTGASGVHPAPRSSCCWENGGTAQTGLRSRPVATSFVPILFVSREDSVTASRCSPHAQCSLPPPNPHVPARFLLPFQETAWSQSSYPLLSGPCPLGDLQPPSRPLRLPTVVPPSSLPSFPLPRVPCRGPVGARGSHRGPPPCPAHSLSPPPSLCPSERKPRAPRLPHGGLLRTTATSLTLVGAERPRA